VHQSCRPVRTRCVLQFFCDGAAKRQLGRVDTAERLLGRHRACRRRSRWDAWHANSSYGAPRVTAAACDKSGGRLKGVSDASFRLSRAALEAGFGHPYLLTPPHADAQLPCHSSKAGFSDPYLVTLLHRDLWPVCQHRASGRSERTRDVCPTLCPSEPAGHDLT
jgi:hypothetical protein